MLGEYDTGYENYIDSLIREIEKLQDENDKLSEQVSSLVGRSFRTADKMSCIEAENAKLQNDAELLRAMLSQVQTEKRCYMADNAKLRESVNRLMTQRDERLARAEKENAKLRELLRAAYNCTNAGPSCLECRIVAGGCTLLSAMRELGVVE